MSEDKTNLNTPLSVNEFDDFAISLIDALKGVDDIFAVAEIKGVLITPELTELLRFVGISCKQMEDKALFGWTDTVINSKKYRKELYDKPYKQSGDN